MVFYVFFTNLNKLKMGKNLSMKQASYSQWATKVCMLLGCLILFSFSGFGGGTSPKFDEKTPLNLKFEKATMLQVLNALKKETSLISFITTRRFRESLLLLKNLRM